ncbi:hypothetical protein [Pedobacter panaciterrae]
MRKSVILATLMMAGINIVQAQDAKPEDTEVYTPVPKVVSTPELTIAPLLMLLYFLMAKTLTNG